MRLKHKTDLIKRSCYQAKNLIEEINKEVAALNTLAKKGGRVFQNEEDYEIFVQDLENALDELQTARKCLVQFSGVDQAKPVNNSPYAQKYLTQN